MTGTKPSICDSPEFQPIHRCGFDPARIELDQRVIGDLPGLGDEAQATVARLRRLLVSEPSIHWSKRMEVTTSII